VEAPSLAALLRERLESATAALDFKTAVYGSRAAGALYRWCVAGGCVPRDLVLHTKAVRDTTATA
jgi:hypothetical protein